MAYTGSLSYDVALGLLCRLQCIFYGRPVRVLGLGFGFTFQLLLLYLVQSVLAIISFSIISHLVLFPKSVGKEPLGPWDTNGWTDGEARWHSIQHDGLDPIRMDARGRQSTNLKSPWDFQMKYRSLTHQNVAFHSLPYC